MLVTNDLLFPQKDNICYLLACTMQCYNISNTQHIECQ